MIKTSYFLDVRFGSESKGHPLKLVFNFKKGRAMISMQVDLKVKQWDRKMQQVVGHPQKAILNVMLQERQVEVNQLLYKLSTAGELEGLSVTQIKNLVAERLFSTPAAPKCRGVRFLSRFDAFVATKSPGTARIYSSTRVLLVSWLGEDAAARITFEQMDVAWLREFERHLVEIRQATNTRAIHFRNIRAVFNDALTDDAITVYPFRKFKLRYETTRKRALSAEHWKKLMALELQPWEERYRDCFLLIFLLCGINIGDLCNLSALFDGRAEYRRAKTHRLYSILVEPEAAEIIDRYRGANHLLNYLDSVQNYRTFYNRLCLALRDMGKRIGVQGLSTYWARHTWATFAARLDIPKETIAAALGHGGNTVTDIYIDFDQHKVDAANRRVIDYAMGLQ